MRDNLPSAAAGAPSPPWKIDPETFAVTPASHADLPLTYVTYAQAVRFTELLTARAEEEGEPWIYELPWAASWEKAARGADARIFAWGNEWDWLLAFGRHSWHGEKEGYPEIPESTFARLGDESPYGLFGMTGNVEEWVHLDDRESAHVSPGIKGGGFARADAMSFRLPRHVSAVLVPSSSTGFRLAARRKGMEKQGPLGDPLRWSRRDSEQ